MALFLAGEDELQLRTKLGCFSRFTAADVLLRTVSPKPPNDDLVDSRVSQNVDTEQAGPSNRPPALNSKAVESEAPKRKNTLQLSKELLTETPKTTADDGNNNEADTNGKSRCSKRIKLSAPSPEPQQDILSQIGPEPKMCTIKLKNSNLAAISSPNGESDDTRSYVTVPEPKDTPVSQSPVSEFSPDSISTVVRRSRRSRMLDDVPSQGSRSSKRLQSMARSSQNSSTSSQNTTKSSKNTDLSSQNTATSSRNTARKSTGNPPPLSFFQQRVISTAKRLLQNRNQNPCDELPSLEELLTSYIPMRQRVPDSDGDLY